MPRRPRVHLPGTPLHIVQRGHNRAPCFFSVEDYHCYLRWLHHALVTTGCTLHAYVLMTNHVHLLLTPDDPRAVAQIIISIGRRYVQYINRTYRRTGTLWDGRYKSSIIQSERYYLACQRYIELNPVRAGMVHDPAHYLWSSYRHHAFGEPNTLITSRPEYLALGFDAEARQSAYRALFRDALDTRITGEIRLAISQSQPLGNERFHTGIERVVGQRREPRPRGRPRKRNTDVDAHQAGMIVQ